MCSALLYVINIILILYLLFINIFVIYVLLLLLLSVLSSTVFSTELYKNIRIIVFVVVCLEQYYCY